MTTGRRKLNALQELVLELAGRPCGCSSKHLQDAAGIDAKAANSSLNGAHKRGRTADPVSHPHDPKHRLHYFTDAAAAKVWQRGPVPAAPARHAASTAQGHAWRPGAKDAPANQTAGASKMASDAPSAPAVAPKITYGPSPVFGIAARYFVDPESVPRFRYGSSGDTAQGAQA